MKSNLSTRLSTLAARTALAVAAMAACGAASALPSFTFDPSAIGLTGQTFTADNLKVSDFATVTYSADGSGFTETGYLQVINAQSGNSLVPTSGLNSTYGLYIAFTSAGVNSVNSSGFTAGTLTSLNYTLYATTGGMYDSSSIVLGTGSLSSGTNVFSSTSSGSTVTTATANASLTFAENAASSAFFESPNPFYALTQTSFTNNTDTITSKANGFTLTAGAGSVTFVAAPVPEPETYALMLGGLGALGFVARRRNRNV